MKKKGGDGLTFRNNLLTSVLNSGHNNLSAARFRIHVVARQNNIHDYQISEILCTLIGQIIGQGAFRRNSMLKILEAFQIPCRAPGKWLKTHAKEYYFRNANPAWMGKFGSNGTYKMPVIEQDMGYKEKLRSHSYCANSPCVA